MNFTYKLILKLSVYLLGRGQKNTLKYYSMGLKQVSFVERSFLSRRVPYRRFHCTTPYCGARDLDGRFPGDV